MHPYGSPALGHRPSLRALVLCLSGPLRCLEVVHSFGALGSLQFGSLVLPPS